MGRPGARSCRSTPGARRCRTCSPTIIGAGLRRAADDRRHQGAHPPAGGAPGDRIPAPARSTAQVLLDDALGRGDQDRDRAGVVAARRGAALRLSPRADLRRALFEETGGMYPELVTRGDLEVFLPPIGGQTALHLRQPARPRRSRRRRSTARVHDECNGSGRVRLRHLHLPALPDARRSRSASRARSAAASA